MNIPLRHTKVLCFSALILASCGENKETTDLTRDSISIKKEDRKFFAGKSDLPQGANEITSAGMGSFHLGDSLEKFMSNYSPAAEKVVDEMSLEDGKYWPSKRLLFKNGSYILVEMVNSIDQVTVIRTNESSFKTRNGLYVGLTLDSLNKPLDSIKADENHKSFTYDSDGVWFKIDSKSEKEYFKNNDPQKSIPSGAEIKELFIICGDC